MHRRIKRTTLMHMGVRKDATNYLCAVGPNWDPYRDVVVITVTYHGGK